ncbi:MAG: 6-phosphogluconolactonase [Proteobacteria bacterium]|nr:6-phosphogluconolactonase [Pseudomonadota bacterium]MBU1611544.1 6-phosphogluconolactonase [Pseudomonadota bacterium]
MREVNILSDHEETCLAAAAWLCYHVAKRATGGFSLAISGGSTPDRFFEILSQGSFAAAMPWKALQLFWVDERCVPMDHADANFTSVAQRLLTKVPIAVRNIHRIPAEAGPYEGAAHYRETLRKYFGASAPVFDLVMLGMGTDGHVASLFPGHPALEAATDSAVPVIVSGGMSGVHPPVDRITLTLPLLNRAKAAMFLVTGREKHEVVRAVLDDNDAVYPASWIRNERTVWFLDERASEG